MASVDAGHGRQKFAAVAPLVLVIGAALIWSGFATYQHAEGPGVPGQIAWTLIAALDGTVVVTTPVWLSTVLPARVRNYAAVICMGALGGSMVINWAETGWIGIFPPLIAGALIHLVGVVLRSFASLDRDPELESDDSEPVDTPVTGVEHPMPSTGSLPDAVAPEVAPSPPARLSPAVDSPVDSVVSEASPEDSRSPAEPSVGDSRPGPEALPRPAVAAVEIVERMLNEAYARGMSLPTGPALTSAVRDAGHEVNEHYGRTTKARWQKRREEVRS